jgi:hypothetical protein
MRAEGGNVTRGAVAVVLMWLLCRCNHSACPFSAALRDYFPLLSASHCLTIAALPVMGA